MTIALVEDGDTGALVASGVAGDILASNSTVNDCVAACILVQSAVAGDVASVTSPMGAFVKVYAFTTDGGLDMEWWVCLKATGASRAITVTTTDGQSWAAQGTEWSGGVASAQSGGATVGTGTTVSQVVNNVMGSAVLVSAQSATGMSAGPTSPWTDYNAGIFLRIYGADVAWQVATTTPVTASWTLNASVGWGASALVLSSGVPSSPTLVSPANASYQDVSPGLEFSGLYNAAGEDAQNAYAMRVKVSGGSYNYWNAGTNALQSAIVWNPDSVDPGGVFGPTLPAAVLTDGNVYNWSLASQDSVTGNQGPFATDFTFTAQLSPSLTVTNPTGSVGGTDQPTVTWVPTFAPGASQVTYQIIVESGTYGTVPGLGTQQWTSGIVTSTASSVLVGVPLTPGVTMRVFVQITETGGVASSWAYSTFTMTSGAPATPGVTAVATVDVDGCPIVELTVQGYDNYLDANDSSFEGGGSGSVGSWVGDSNTTIAPSSTVALDGSWSLRFTAVAAGTENATSGYYPATGAQEYTFMASMRAGGAGRSCSFKVNWYEGATLLSTQTLATHADNSGAWVDYIGTVVAPTLATQYTLTMSIAGVTGTGEHHYLDCVGVFPPGAGTWAIGGFVGLTYAVITRSDNLYVRYASMANPLPIPSGTQTEVVYDYEAVPGVEYTYSVVVTVPSVPITSQNAVSGDVTVTTTAWWELDPTAGTATSNPSATSAQMVGWTPVQTEQATANPVINQPVMNIAANTMMNQDFSATAEVFSAPVYVAFNALLTGQKTIFISSPWGSLDSGYFRIGPESGGQSGGSGTTAKNTTLMPSTAEAPHRSVAITAVAQARPPV